MSVETFKLLLSIVSAIVAVFGAFMAYRTRRQTRLDLFETQKHLLLLAAAENDAHLKTVQFEAEVLQQQIRDLGYGQTESEVIAAERLLLGLRSLDDVLRALQRRDWTGSQMESTQYSEEALAQLRRFLLDEQVLARTLQLEAHQLLLQEARARVQRRVGAT